MANNKTKKLTIGAILTALVIILQLAGAFIKFGTFSISLVLVPIVLGAALCGSSIACWLGLVFGVVVLASGDAAPFLAVNVAGTVITVLLKGVACGFFAGLGYKLFNKINPYLAVAVAAILCPVANTGVFLLGCRLFFWETIIAWGSAAGFADAGKYAIYVLVGLNFVFELILNIVLSPVIVRLLNIAKKQK